VKGCVNNGCLWTAAAKNKPAVCSSCSDEKEKNCLKKNCVLVKKGEVRACTSCATMKGKSGKCFQAKCAYDKMKKICEPCGKITKEKICTKMKSCSWKSGKKGKKGKCGKVKGKVVITCCEFGQVGSPEYRKCCAAGNLVCPSQCPGWGVRR